MFGITPSKTTAAPSRVTVLSCKETARMRSLGSADATDDTSTKIAFKTRR
jgi:hypothetical protein